MRKWNRNLTFTENLKVAAKQPAARLNLLAALVWSVVWMALSFLAYIRFDPGTFYLCFLIGPLAALLLAACGAYLALSNLPAGRDIVLQQSIAGADEGPRKWLVVLPFLLAWLPFAPAADAGWVSAARWIEPAAAAYAGARLGLAALMLRGRFG